MQVVLLSLLAGLTAAWPYEKPNAAAPLKRQGPIYEAPDGLKNTQVFISDTTMKWGTVNPLDVIKRLDSECDSSGCNSTFTEETNIHLGNGNLVPATITIDVQSNYEAWAKRGLAQIHAVFMEEIMKDDSSEREEKWTDHNCVAGPVPICSNTERSYFQYFAPKRINVRQEEDDFQMQWDISVEADSGPGMCKLVTGMGAAITAGVASLTGAFGVAAIFCD
ncbi:hypothetical protein PRZ48_004282 [Zasmidium cellare]|uniref:Uncharacterized protein n=1 Tax=Zasmidium cellare TaxID=395010 RepID=A0ABR0EPD4_ZASCE|nr:hypothetical protein PRZ48_004282 [Zasmidium cellare]